MHDVQKEILEEEMNERKIGGAKRRKKRSK